MAKKQKTRLEHDFLGEKEIPDNVYYGVQTLRALENFKITDIPISLEPRFVQALGYVKKAAALANMDLGVLPEEIARAIIVACDAVIAGELNDQFVVDVIQGGAGTSTNMNANEVIANKALEILGHEKGRYEIVHPNNHINWMQPGSSIMPGKVNPVIPEVVNQIAFEVIGMDVTVTLAAEAGQLQLNVMEPIMAFELFMMLEMLKRGCRVLENRCIKGITANAERCRELVLNSIGIVTALNPIIGYEKSAEIAKQALETGKSVRDIVIDEGLIDTDKLEEILSVENLMHPKFFRE